MSAYTHSVLFLVETLRLAGTRAHNVSVSCFDDVVDFREAVRLKYDSPNYLGEIPSSVLLVYKNKSAFYKLNAAVDDSNGLPLKSSHTLDGLGRSEE